VRIGFYCIFAGLKLKSQTNMFGYQYPTWVAILFFVVLLAISFAVGRWLVKKDRNYDGL
jgi:hypothetical protein